MTTTNLTTRKKILAPTGANKDVRNIVEDINSVDDFSNFSYAHRFVQRQMIVADVDFAKTAFQIFSVASQYAPIFSANVIPKGAVILNAWTYCLSALGVQSGTVSFFLGDRTSAFMSLDVTGANTAGFNGMATVGDISRMSVMTTATVYYANTTGACDIKFTCTTSHDTGQFRLFVEYLPMAGN